MRLLVVVGCWFDVNDRDWIDSFDSLETLMMDSFPVQHLGEFMGGGGGRGLSLRGSCKHAQFFEQEVNDGTYCTENSCKFCIHLLTRIFGE
jgi:hypothetical protein